MSTELVDVGFEWLKVVGRREDRKRVPVSINHKDKQGGECDYSICTYTI